MANPPLLLTEQFQTEEGPARRAQLCALLQAALAPVPPEATSERPPQNGPQSSEAEAAP